MIVISITDCPAVLRGDLTKWLFEINVGVYVGQVSARVRDELWNRILEHCKVGRVTMVYQTNNEQRMRFRVHNSDWKPIDFDGLTLMLRPKDGYLNRPSSLRPGFSKAAQRQIVKRIQAAELKRVLNHQDELNNDELIESDDLSMEYNTSSEELCDSSIILKNSINSNIKNIEEQCYNDASENEVYDRKRNTDAKSQADIEFKIDKVSRECSKVLSIDLTNSTDEVSVFFPYKSDGANVEASVNIKSEKKNDNNFNHSELVDMQLDKSGHGKINHAVLLSVRSVKLPKVDKDSKFSKYNNITLKSVKIGQKDEIQWYHQNNGNIISDTPLIRKGEEKLPAKSSTAPIELFINSKNNRVHGKNVIERALHQTTDKLCKRTDGSVFQRRYVVIDIETTGLDENNDEIIELGAIRIEDGKMKEQFQCLIQTEDKLPDFIIKLTGITDEMLEKKGVLLEDGLMKFISFIGDDTLVGHNIEFDIKFIQSALKEIGMPELSNLNLCTLNLAKQLLPNAKRYSLKSLIQYLGIKSAGEHRSLADCENVYRLYEMLYKK